MRNSGHGVALKTCPDRPWRQSEAQGSQTMHVVRKQLILKTSSDSESGINKTNTAFVLGDFLFKVSI